MFERDHGPLEYQIGLRPGAASTCRCPTPTSRPDMPPSMRAAVLHTPGSPPSYGEHPAPAAAAGSTLVRVTAAPVVPLDLLCAIGTSYFGVPGDALRAGRPGRRCRRGVGHVRPTGSRVWFFATGGDEAGRRRPGRAVRWCRTHDVVPIEAEVPDELAAALGLSGVAAWMALSWRARLQPGERVLVLGGGGAVGQAGIGAARVLGASTVVAVARPASIDRASGRRAPTSSSRSTATSTPLTAALARARAVRRRARPGLRRRGHRGLAQPGRARPPGQPRRRRRATRRRSPRSVLRSRTASVLGYTNNALSADQRREAITAVLGHAAAGRIRIAVRRAARSPRSSRCGRGSPPAEPKADRCWCPERSGAAVRREHAPRTSGGSVWQNTAFGGFAAPRDPGFPPDGGVCTHPEG